MTATVGTPTWIADPVARSFDAPSLVEPATPALSSAIAASSPIVAQTRTTPPAYRDDAGRYDHRTRTFQYWRELLVRTLAVEPGDTVLDIGCGTGLCIPGLQHKIGPTGTVIGIDASQQMLDIAAARVADHSGNVRLITAPIDQACVGATADAALFCAVHDILQSPAALANIFAHLRPGAAVASIGGQWPHPWLLHLRVWVAHLHAPFITDFTGFDQPWTLLADYVPDLQVRQLGLGTGYLAHGHYQPREDSL